LIVSWFTHLLNTDRNEDVRKLIGERVLLYRRCIVLPVVKLEAPGSRTPVIRPPCPVVVPPKGRPSLICEAITVPPEEHVLYVFELRRTEKLEFILCSDLPLDVILCKAADYDRWMESASDVDISMLACWQEVEIVEHRTSFTAPERETYAVALINLRETRVEVAVEIRLLLPAILW
jgi:hypothetical protein